MPSAYKQRVWGDVGQDLDSTVQHQASEWQASHPGCPADGLIDALNIHSLTTQLPVRPSWGGRSQRSDTGSTASLKELSGMFYLYLYVSLDLVQPIDLSFSPNVLNWFLFMCGKWMRRNVYMWKLGDFAQTLVFIINVSTPLNISSLMSKDTFF